MHTNQTKHAQTAENTKHTEDGRVADAADPSTLPPPQQQQPDSDPPITNRFMLRVLLLVTLIVGFDFWLARQTGNGLRDPALMGGAGALLLAALLWSEKIVSSVADDAWKKWLRWLTLRVLRWRVLTILYLTVGFMMVSLAAVVVVSDGSPLPSGIEIAAIDDISRPPSWLCDSSESVYRECVWVALFGSSYRLDVPGYLPRLIEVYPLVGARVRPEEDLRRSPTVLFRPNRIALNTLKRCEDPEIPGPERCCARFELCHMKLPTLCTPLVSKTGHTGSFLIGWSKSLPSGLTQDWQFELMAREFDVDTALADTLLKWKHYAVFPPSVKRGYNRVSPLKSGMKLRARVYSKAGKVVACKLLTVEDVAFLDVAMVSALTPLTSEAKKCAT
ncbi:MAG: hypothetical protein GY875_14480 [Gammaproteobacteria bacterium]|nr:hypothetical protein [Gammaproteobacteria bacterium]